MKRIKITLPEGGRRIGELGSNVGLNRGVSFELQAEKIIIEGDATFSGNVNASKPKMLPFDLEAAKSGAPLVTRDGRKAHFVAHDPGANEGYRLLVRIENDGCAIGMPTECRWDGVESLLDLFMAPKPKRSVWINLYTAGSNGSDCGIHDSEEEARKAAGVDCIGIAQRVEIDA